MVKYSYYTGCASASTLYITLYIVVYVLISILGIVNIGTHNIEGYLLLPLFLGDLFVKDKICATYFGTMLRVPCFHTENIFNRPERM